MSLQLLFISLLLFLVGFFLRDAVRIEGSPLLPVQNDRPTPAQIPIVIKVDRGGDDRYTIAPRPQRKWNTESDTSVTNEIGSIPTRGYPEQYQQMGIMTTEGGKVLPLYGRRVAPRSDRFQYYTRTDTYNPVALPVSFKKRDCQDQVGCDEVFDGDSIKMAGTGEIGTVKLYRFDGPVY